MNIILGYLYWFSVTHQHFTNQPIYKPKSYIPSYTQYESQGDKSSKKSKNSKTGLPK